MPAAGGTVRVITETPEIEEDMSLTADGKTLVYERTPVGNQYVTVDVSRLLRN